MKKLRHLMELAGLRLALGLVDRLPLRLVNGLAGRVAGLWYALDAPRRREAQKNIRRSGVAAEPREIRRIARESFRHFGICAAETVKAAGVFTPDNWRERVRLEIHPEARRLLETPGQGVILVTGHLGNWELAGQLLSFIKPVAGVARTMNNPYTDRLLRKRLERYRFRVTPKRDADSLRFLSALKNGEILALLPDQHARAGGMMIEFFGIPASTHTTPAMLHLVTRRPLCFGYCARTGPLRYLIRISEPIARRPTGNREADVRALLGAINRQLEDAIRLYPGQYLWAHRRWRNPPPAQKATSSPAM